MKYKLFYTKSDRTAFFVANCGLSGGNVTEMIKYLNEMSLQLAQRLGCKQDVVKTTFVSNTSRNYKNMRVFYVENVDEPKGDNLFLLEGGWTMYSWVNF